MCLQFEDDAHNVVVVEGIVELDKPRVLEGAHNIHFTLNISSVFSFGGRDKLGGQLQSCLFFSYPIYGAEFSSNKNINQIVAF